MINYRAQFIELNDSAEQERITRAYRVIFEYEKNSRGKRLTALQILSAYMDEAEHKVRLESLLEREKDPIVSRLMKRILEGDAKAHKSSFFPEDDNAEEAESNAKSQIRELEKCRENIINGTGIEVCNTHNLKFYMGFRSRN